MRPEAKYIHPVDVIPPHISLRLIRNLAGRAVSALFIATFLLFPALAQKTAQYSPLDPLPEDTGRAGFTQTLRKLGTTARLLQVTAHPDDEDGGMLTLEARGEGVSTTLLTLTRGEGGQNKTGSNLFDVLGVLRTLELTASDRYYGVNQRFTRVADFGYSKSAVETFQKWGGHDPALSDVVRVIRTFRPDVLIARFSGTERDGHGNHQASAILTKEAFRAAADPNRFPEQIAEGLYPWQAKKLYIGNICGYGANACPAENYTVKLNTGRIDAVLGKSYVQFAMDGLRHQLSQGAGGWSAEPGDRFTFYKLIDSSCNLVLDQDGHEKDFWDGIDTSLAGLAARLGDEGKKVPQLQKQLRQIDNDLHRAIMWGEKDPDKAVDLLAGVLKALHAVQEEIEHSALSPMLKADIAGRLQDKLQQTETALNLALHVTLDATVISPTERNAKLPSEPAGLPVISPGQKFAVRVTLHNGSQRTLERSILSLRGIHHAVKDQEEQAGTVQPGQDHVVLFVAQASDDMDSTQPYWHRSNPETEARNTIDDPQYATLPFPPFPFTTHAGYEVKTEATTQADATRVEISAPVIAHYRDEEGKEQKRKLAAAPAFSVILEPAARVIPLSGAPASTVTVQVSCNLTGAPKGMLHLAVPPGWQVEPTEAPVELSVRGEKKDFEFRVFPANLKEGRAEIQAVLKAGGKTYGEGYSVVTREDLDTFYYYQTAIQHISIVNVKVPRNLKVGYILGAGDDIPTVLQQIGINVTMIPSAEITSENLHKFDTIVLGIRAYDTQKDVATNNKKLLDFVASGGTLIVQYNASISDFNSGHFTPYPLQLSRTRVSVEEAPMEILSPQNPLMREPNAITHTDFDGWVQERGLYFADHWDEHYTALLACNDPGEPPQKGGLLRAQYGKGTYIYTGYAFFRQVPAGVPGAIRLFVNLLNAGHEDGR